ncbi:arginine--tRNA ligase [Flavisolibacter ginsenosidimutans]|uniref:Arginine--tRNA ligase n=1 Tax=Flavisolibacter ginsenosidimutans TaxID=661481 RepID=A0A5B8UDE5_9BACT|nr:arginine--tRNA ligase [Flavisolibacter ginsenosidimutans]QEC54701.1 arginine--tRNA ligase [Flavisolibacter ginsenosidimutans]
MSLAATIKDAAAKSIKELYGVDVSANDITINQTKAEFEGDYTLVLFTLVKQLRKAPEQLGKDLGEHLLAANNALFTSFNVIKGFLNLTVSDNYFVKYLSEKLSKDKLVDSTSAGKKIMVEYSSPNTNKPLHLGHLRNNFLGWSVAEILKATGNEVMKSCIVNDRGIHICKSMIAWELFGNGETPQSTGIKGDHFVGDYYVKCESQIKKEASELADKVEANDYAAFSETDKQKLVELKELGSAVPGTTDKDKEKLKKIGDDVKEIIRANTPIMKRAQEMLRDWEAGKPEVIELWKKMNGWVYEGFDQTYKRIGSDFDKTYYESETYLLGKQFVEEGLAKGVLFRKDDGSVWIDLTDEGLDEKLVLRRDGTSVYITQDIGLADEKYKEFPYDQSFYVIADEQNYHMKVLQLILKKLGKPYADGIYHLSYGMVELPSGRMKSREGTVVDADDLIDEMVEQSKKVTAEKSNIADFSESELKELYETVALGALKFFLLKVDPKKRMVFNPEESIDFQGFTGPFIQYTHARLKSILRKAEDGNQQSAIGNRQLEKLEKELLVVLEQFGEVVQQAANEHNPSAIANYVYSVAKTFNSFYTVHSVLKAESEEKKALRLQLCGLTANVIKEGMGLLGIRVPERM